MKTIRPRLTYANVVSTLALIAAVGGGTTAIAMSGKVGAKDLAKVKVREVGSPPDVASVDVLASCAKRERLVGGGGEVGGNGLTESRPEGNGWRVQGAASGPPNPTTSGKAYALCLTK